VVTLFQSLYTHSLVTADRVGDRLATLKSEKGASAVEYALLVAMIAVVVAAAVLAFGDRLTALFNGITLTKPASTTPAAG